jgi:mono/diheme cytochrome c family protein
MKIIVATAGVLLLLSAGRINIKSEDWKAPADADKMANPLKGNAEASEAGKKLFIQFCAVCHGDKGKGDGVAGISLKPKPANFTLDKIQQQTDGALFWKLTEGRPPMASFKSILTETQRWQLVNYLRSFKITSKK